MGANTGPTSVVSFGHASVRVELSLTQGPLCNISPNKVGTALSWAPGSGLGGLPEESPLSASHICTSVIGMMVI